MGIRNPATSSRAQAGAKRLATKAVINAALQAERQIAVRHLSVLRADDQELLLKEPLTVTDYAGDGYFLTESTELESSATGQTQAEAQQLFEALVIATYNRYRALPPEKLTRQARILLQRLQALV